MSAHCEAEPPVTLAVIRFAAGSAGMMAPKTSWVTLPMAPIGVMLVSPDTRVATTASTPESRTPRSAAHQAMSKRRSWARIESTKVTSAPARNHFAGTSPVDGSSSASPAEVSLWLGAPAALEGGFFEPVKVETIERHENEKETSDDTTIKVTPGQSSHSSTSVKFAVTGWSRASPSIRPRNTAIGALASVVGFMARSASTSPLEAAPSTKRLPLSMRKRSASSGAITRGRRASSTAGIARAVVQESELWSTLAMFDSSASLLIALCQARSLLIAR